MRNHSNKKNKNKKNTHTQSWKWSEIINIESMFSNTDTDYFLNAKNRSQSCLASLYGPEISGLKRQLLKLSGWIA
jgi:hypothetical protein